MTEMSGLDREVTPQGNATTDISPWYGVYKCSSKYSANYPPHANTELRKTVSSGSEQQEISELKADGS